MRAQTYDLLIVGAGLFGCIVAHEATQRGLKVLVAERRDHIGGNCYTADVGGIQVHQYGAHIFRTSDPQVLAYLTQFATLNHFVNSPVANYHGKLYNLPFNMNTFYALWGATTPDEVMAKLDQQREPCENPSNLEEHILALVGRDIYEILVKGYTEKQWGHPCTELPASIMRRIPLRFVFDNNYFTDPYQGIPIGGYTPIFEQLLAGCDVRLGVDYLNQRDELDSLAHKVLYTGALDAYFDYCYGPLEFRSLRFDHERLETPNYQGVAVMNFTDADTPYTRVIEHKHFDFDRARTDFTIISHEYPCAWEPGIDPYYPMEDAANQARQKQYMNLAQAEPRTWFGGRLAEYRYYDMQDTIKSALAKASVWLGPSSRATPLS